MCKKKQMKCSLWHAKDYKRQNKKKALDDGGDHEQSKHKLKHKIKQKRTITTSLIN